MFGYRNSSGFVFIYPNRIARIMCIRMWLHYLNTALFTSWTADRSIFSITYSVDRYPYSCWRIYVYMCIHMTWVLTHSIYSSLSLSVFDDIKVIDMYEMIKISQYYGSNWRLFLKCRIETRKYVYVKTYAEYCDFHFLSGAFTDKD